MNLKYVKKYDSKFNIKDKQHKYRSLGMLPKVVISDSASVQKMLEKANMQQIENNDQEINLLKQSTQLNQNVYWKQFAQKCNEIKAKNYISSINIRGRIIHQIIQRINQQSKDKSTMIGMKQFGLQSQYKKSHQYYEELKFLKQKKKITKNKYKEMTIINGKVTFIDLNQKIKNKLEEIQQFQGLLAKKQNQLEQIRKQIDQITNNKLNFLLILLKKGYYRYDGIKWVLQQLQKMNYTPKPSDMPDALDRQSKKCLTKQFQNIQIDNKTRRNASMKYFMTQPSMHNSKIQAITKKRNDKKTYFGAAEYLNTWVQSQGWKSKLVRIGNNKDLGQRKVNWKQRQFIRIKKKYNENSRKQMQNLLFGFNSARIPNTQR